MVVVLLCRMRDTLSRWEPSVGWDVDETSSLPATMMGPVAALLIVSDDDDDELLLAFSFELELKALAV